MATSQSSIVVQMTSDEARLLEGMRKIIEKESQMADGLTKAEKEAAKTERAMNKMAERIKELNLTPLERYNREVAKADQLLQKGKLTQEEFNREVARQGTIMRGRTTEEQSFAGALRQTAAEMLTVETATRALSAAFSAVEQARDKALGGFREKSEATRRLNQIADSDPNSSRSLAALESRADTAAGLYGVDRSTARQVLFAAYSEGFDKDYERVLAASSVVDPLAAAGVAGQIPALYKGKIKPMEAVDLTLAAARESRLPFEGIATAMPIVSEGASMQGSTPEEAAALLSVLASRFKSGETAGDRLKLLATKFSIDPQFQGLGIMGAYDKLAALPEEERRAFLGDSTELNTAFGVIGQERELILQRTAEMQNQLAASRAGRGAVQEGIGRALSDPLYQADQNARSETVKAEIARERASAKPAADAEFRRRAGQQMAYYFGERLGGQAVGEMAGSLAALNEAPILRSAYDIGWQLGGWVENNPTAAAYAAYPGIPAVGAVTGLLTGGSNEENVSAAAKDLRDAAADIRAAAAENRPAAAQAKAKFGRDQ